MLKVLHRLSFLFLLWASFGVGIAQSSWREITEYRSTNGHYWVKVAPPTSTAIATKGFKVELGELRWGFIHKRQSFFNLVDSSKPWKVLISNDGRLVIAIAHLVYQVRRPDRTAVVIYRLDGSVVRALTLQDIFTEGDLEVLEQKFSQVVYDAELQQEWVLDGLIDETRGCLLLKVAQQADNLPKVDIAIELAKGTLVEPLQDRLWHRRFGKKVVPEPIPEDSSDLLPLVAENPMPVYPPLAKIARIQGTVTVELELDSEGRVTRAKALKGPIQLHRVTEEALSHWRFRPGTNPLGSNRIGKVAIRFGGEETRP